MDGAMRTARCLLPALLLLAALGTAAAGRLLADAAGVAPPSRQLLQANNTRCPAGCDVSGGGCVLDSSAGGYRCTRCLGALVINDADGTCGCPAGMYATTDDCADCLKGSWCAGGKYVEAGTPGQTACSADGLLTTLGQRSTSIKACVNNRGSFYTLGANGSPVATSCPVDTYGSGLRKQRACVPCPPGYTTNGLAGRSKPSDCLVPEGYSNKAPGQIAPCSRGMYKSGFAPTTDCTPCPRGVLTARVASTRAADCSILMPGRYAVAMNGTMITATERCPQKLYCQGGTPAAAFDPSAFDPANAASALAGTQVQQCPDGTWTQGIGSTSPSECMTPPGFKTSGGNTSECGDGEYRAEWKAPAVATSCDKCGDGIFSMSTDFLFVYNITADATRRNLEVRSSSSGCYIKPGQGMNYMSATRTYKAVNCINGGFGVAGITLGLSANPCRPCAQGLMTNASITPDLFTFVDGAGGYTSPKACITTPGFGISGREAVRCQQGFWSTPGGSGVCNKCPVGTTTADNPDLQTSLDSCVIAAGYGAYDGTIIACPVGTYNDVMRNDTVTPCTPCGAGLTTSQAGGTAASACDQCLPGWGGTGCAAQCGGAGGATFGPAGRDKGQPCQACPEATVGFLFDYGGDPTMNMFVPDLVARLGATNGGDCLSRYVQWGQEPSWYLGGNASLVPVASAGNFSACVAACTAASDCQYITFEYDAPAGSSKCFKRAKGSGSDVIAYKAAMGGDTSAMAVRRQKAQGAAKAKALASGSYTFYGGDDTSGVGAEAVPLPAGTSVQACLSACDDDGDCAAVAFAGLSSNSTISSTPTGCSILRGDGSVAKFKRTMIKADVSRLSLAVAW